MENDAEEIFCRGEKVMKKGFLFCFLALTFLIPINVLAQPPFYLAIKPGIYSPQSSDLDGFDTGFSGEIAFGYRLTPNLAGEIGVGFFYTHGENTVGGATYGGQEFDIYVYPITFTLKAILPYKRWEFYGLAGVGVYIVSGPYEYHDHHYDNHHHDYDDDDYDYDAIFGGYLGAGIHYNITPRIFVGAEGKYLWTDKAKIEYGGFGPPYDLKFKMDGIIATGVFGFRF
jgi:opacity protein-like surface antigen